MAEITEAVPQQTMGLTNWVEEQVRNTPWWLISIAFHLILLAGMTVVTFKETVKVDDVPLIIPLGATKPRIPVNRPDVFDGPKGVVKYDGTEVSKNDDPIIDWIEAEESDHNESANEQDFGKMIGESMDFLSGTPGRDGGNKGRGIGGPGNVDVMGPGGGAGGAGRHGGDLGGRVNRRKVGPSGSGRPTAASESAVTYGLRWLARHQSPDGKWSAAGFHGQCAGTKCTGDGYHEFDSGLTGLSLLAFLGAGYTHLTKESYVDPHTGKTIHWGAVIKNGLKWLMENQDAEGCFGGRSGGKYMYNHAIAALAMGEAYGLTNSGLFKEPAQKGIDFLVASQNPYKAWRYSKLCGDNDTSVTGWAVMALKSAEISGLHVSRTSYDGALAFVREVTDEAYWKTGYTAKGSGKVVVPGKNEDWDGHEALTAVGMLCRTFIEKNGKDPALEGGATVLMSDLPKYSGKAIDYYYWYYASLALFQLDGFEGKHWKTWDDSLKKALVPTQMSKKDGCKDGSWDSDCDRWGFEGGRVYATAINVLTLEVSYRYESVIGGTKRK